MPKTIQQFISEYDKIKKNIEEAKKEEEVIKSQARNLFAKNKLEYDSYYPHAFLMGTYNPNESEIAVWSKLSPNARRNFSLKDIETFKNLNFDNLDRYVKRDGGVDSWWRGLFNGYKTFYNAWGRMDTFGISNHPQGHFQYGEDERNTYMLGALYADNHIGNNSAPFLDVRRISGDGIGHRAGTQYSGSYHILKSGVENAKIIKGITYNPEKIVYLNDTQEVKNLQERYKKNFDLRDTLEKKLEDLEREKNFLQPEKLELIEQYKRISGAIDKLRLKVANIEQTQKAQKNLTDSFFKGSAKGMSMRDELMSQSESFQKDISELKKNFNAERNRTGKNFSFFGDTILGFDKKFKDLKSLYSVNESKLKEDSNLIKEDVTILQASNADLNKKVFVIQKEMDDNSKNYALEKEKISRAIEGLRKKGDEFIPAINDLSSKLANLTKAHDLTKNKLLDNMKSLEKLNQTQFDEIKNKNEDFKKRYDKDTEQLQRELVLVRAGMEVRDRDINHLSDEVAQSRDAYVELKEQSNVKFKTLFDYNAYTNRQIQKQNTKRTTTLGNIKKATQPDLLKKAFAGIARGRFFEAQPILY